MEQYINEDKFIFRIGREIKEAISTLRMDFN